MSTRYVKKPVIVEAFQMTRERRYDNKDWPDWLNEAWNKKVTEAGALYINPFRIHSNELVIHTLEGVLEVSWNDWIIRGTKGELYPCKPDIFNEIYEPI